MKESDSTEPGDTIEEPYTALEPEGMGAIGSLICFDLRFPEPSLNLVRRGADVILYPSAFTVPTGKAHWELLLRGRAIETQSWVVASAQCGRHNEKRVSYGDALVVNPRGEVVGRLGRVDDVKEETLRDGDSGEQKRGSRDEDMLLVDIEVDLVREVRKVIPLKRRTDVYPKI